MEDDLNGIKFQWRTTSMEEDLKEALQEDDISLFSQPILYWAWPSSAPACFVLLPYHAEPIHNLLIWNSFSDYF